MSDFNEHDIVRDTAGRFGEKSHSAPEAALPELSPAETTHKLYDERYWQAVRARSEANAEVREAAKQAFISETWRDTPEARKAVFYWEDGNDSGHLVFHAYLDENGSEIDLDGEYPDSGLSDYDDWEDLRHVDVDLDQDAENYEKFTLDIPAPQLVDEAELAREQARTAAAELDRAGGYGGTMNTVLNTLLDRDDAVAAKVAALTPALVDGLYEKFISPAIDDMEAELA